MKLSMDEIKFKGRWIELGKYHTELGNPEPKRQIWHIFAYM